MAFSSRAGRARSRPTASCSFSPTCEPDAFPIATGPGMVVSILAGVNADGTANMSLAGTLVSGRAAGQPLQRQHPRAAHGKPVARHAARGLLRDRDHGWFRQQLHRRQHSRSDRQIVHRHSARRRGLWNSHHRQPFHRRNDIQYSLHGNGDLPGRRDQLGGQRQRERSRYRRVGRPCRTWVR